MHEGCVQIWLVDLVGWVSVGDAQSVHGANHGVHSHEDILIDELDETASVVVRVAGSVDDAHLFDERALARLAGTFTWHTRCLSAACHRKRYIDHVTRSDAIHRTNSNNTVYLIVTLYSHHAMGARRQWRAGALAPPPTIGNFAKCFVH